MASPQQSQTLEKGETGGCYLLQPLEEEPKQRWVNRADRLETDQVVVVILQALHLKRIRRIRVRIDTMDAVAAIPRLQVHLND